MIYARRSKLDADVSLFLCLAQEELLRSSDGKLADCKGRVPLPVLAYENPIIWATCWWPVDACFLSVDNSIKRSLACRSVSVWSCVCVCVCSSPSVVQASCEPVEASGMFSRRGCCLLCLLLRAAAQRFVSFDEAIASSVYSAKTFGADVAMTESSGYWCSAGGHEPGQVVSWTGVFKSRRKLMGVKLRWSYAPAEVKVLTSSDGGNFQESASWRKLERTEPSFEDTILFSEPVTVKAVKVMMRGSKPWGYFGLSTVALSEPSAFMLVSGAPAPKEQCVVAASDGLAARHCVDAVVTGSEIFAGGATGQLRCWMGVAWALWLRSCLR